MKLLSQAVLLASSIAVTVSTSGLRASSSEHRHLQTATAICGVTSEDLDFQSCNPEGCCGNVMNHLKQTMAAKGCNTQNMRTIKRELKAYTGQRNAKVAKQDLRDECENSLNNDDDDNEEDDDDEDDDETDEPTDACTSIDSLNFRTINKCDNNNIITRVEEEMTKTNCAHNINEELKLITGKDGTDEARESILQSCYGVFGCTSSFEADGCDYIQVIEKIKRKVRSCPHDADAELQKMTGTSSLDDAKAYLNEACNTAFGKVSTTTTTNIDSRFDEGFMNDYIGGGTFLNNETGNFQGNNPSHPTSDQSKTAGNSINNFYNGEADSTILLNTGWGGFDQCQNQAYMCCFGRDRQSNDDNGNCAKNDCSDADPGDNSNLCFTEPSNTPYFGEIEDDIHCHGLAWGSDSNDLISRFTMNNFFYVSMYDHLYQRGYVEPAVTGGPDDLSMCGCIEDMPKVSRSDCTQVDVELEFTITRDDNGLLIANAINTPEVEFNSCRGTDFDDGNNANNDLASYAVRLTNEGRMNSATRDTIFKTLLGYANPGDNDNEEVCISAYEELTGATHPCTDIDGTELDGCDFQTISEAIEDNLRGDCPHGIEEEMKLLTGAATYDDAVSAINDICSNAWDQVATSSFESISDTFDDGFMQEYIRGDTFLNLKTGNFQGRQTGKSDAASVEAGEEIGAFYKANENGASNTVMKANFPSDVTNFEECALNSIMCCFGRDRQFGDNNGNCNKRNCDDADPADNSNLCYTEPSNTPFPQEAEGDVHCHGLAWAEDKNDFSAKLKYNNFFYVSLYDHMYERGYVQEMTFDRTDITDVVPMCGCMENMHPVSRSDCTEVEVEQTFQFSIGADGKLQAEPRGEMEIEFNACAGINPGNPNKRANNDLASYVYRLQEEGKISNDTKNAIYKKLVGYEKPGKNDNENACRVAYKEETGEDYPRN